MIRRPLMYITASFTAAVAIACSFGTGYAVTGIIVIVTILPIMKFSNRTAYTAMLLILFSYTAGTAVFYLDDRAYRSSLFDDGEKVCLEGEVMESDVKDGTGDTEHIQVKMKTDIEKSWTGRKYEKILVNFYRDNKDKENAGHSDYPIPGDEICVTGEIRQPDGRKNPRCFDYSLYLRTIGISTSVNAESIEILTDSGSDTVIGRLHVIRENFIGKLEECAGNETSSMMAGILFGKEDDIDESVLEEFRMNGTAHILAVSGLHIGMVYGFISRLWIWRKGKAYFTAAMLFLICYSVMASFSPSVVRAVIMIGFHIFASINHKRYDLCSAALIAALMMLLKNPMYLYNTGFQMSFIAIFSIVLIMPVVNRAYKGILLGGIAIQAGIAPYVAYNFNYFSVAAVFVNIPIIFIAGLVVPLGIVSIVVAETCPYLFQVLAGMMKIFCDLITELNHATVMDGITVFNVTSPDIKYISLYYIAVILFLSEEGRLAVIRKGKKMIIFTLIISVSISMILGKINREPFDDAEVIFVDVGQGDCIHLRTETGENYLIDGGGSDGYDIGRKVLRPYLLKNGTDMLDGIFVTHLHTDHYKGAAELCRLGMVKKLFIYDGNRKIEKKVMKETGMSREDIVYVHMGQNLKLSDRWSLDVLWPEKRTEKQYADMLSDDEDENEMSLILKLITDRYSVLLTGDIDTECQSYLADKWGGRLKCSVLKVPHHGSRYSYCEEFVEAADPEYAVFQVGKNSFGHPDEGVIENYRRKGIMIYRNDKNGAVAFDLKNGYNAQAIKMEKDR